LNLLASYPQQLGSIVREFIAKDFMKGRGWLEVRARYCPH